LDEQFDLVSQAGQLREEFVGRSVDVVRQSVWTILNVLITMFTLFFFFRDRHEARQAVRALIPLSDGECDDVFRRVRDTIHATIYGSVLMAAIQGALGGLMFWWLGLPAPVLWGVVMGLLATVPNLGTFIIWGPTAAGLALHDEWTKATILTIWGLVAIGLIDNLLYPIMVGQRMRMHSALVFFAILGGLQVFGPAGLVLGPVVFALAQALIEIWRRRTANGHAAEAGAAPKLLLPDQAAAAPSPPIKLVS
jgi:predicted PurR-regulated permease PerM